MTTALFEPWIVLPSPSHLRGPSTLIHELTHYLAYLALQQQTPWFAEGIATYFETAILDETGALVLGAVPIERAQWLQHRGMMPLQELLADNVDKQDERFYPSSWLLVHSASGPGHGVERGAGGRNTNRARQHASSNERDHALRCAKTARKLAPTNPALLRSEARLLSAMGACDELKLVLTTLNNLDALPEVGFETVLLTRCSLRPASTKS